MGRHWSRLRSMACAAGVGSGPIPPAAPIGVVFAFDVQNRWFAIGWDTPSVPVDGWRIEYQEECAGPWLLSDVVMWPGSGSAVIATANINPPGPRVTYTARIRSFAGTLYSAWVTCDCISNDV